MAISSGTAAWFYAMLLWVLAPARAERIPTIEENRETAEERDTRYQSIAADLASVVLDPEEAPLFKGPDARARTGAVLLGISRFESGDWNLVVDRGIGKMGRGDHGDSWCLMQIYLPEGHRTTAEGWTGEDLVEDRTKCFRAALHIVRASFGECRANAVEERLASYTGGTCTGDLARKLSRNRMKQAFAFVAHEAPPSDVTIAAFLE